ncbi:ATP-binding cassette domain-containing protein [Niallia circulans]
MFIRREKQRVGIARALMANPKVLICDEPTGNLDIENRDNILRILIECKNKGQTIIIVTHDEEVAKLGDKTYKLYKGNLKENEVFV